MLLGIGFENFLFVWGGCAEPEEFNEVMGLRVEVGMFIFCKIGKPLAGVEDEVVVEESKGLKGGDGGRSFRGEKAKIGEV